MAADRVRLAWFVLDEKLRPRDPLAPAAPEPDWLAGLLLRAGVEAGPDPVG